MEPTHQARMVLKHQQLIFHKPIRIEPLLALFRCVVTKAEVPLRTCLNLALQFLLDSIVIFRTNSSSRLETAKIIFIILPEIR